MREGITVACGIMLAMFNLHSEPKPKADVYVNVTDDLPKWRTGIMLWYNGVFSVTNTGEVAFTIITDKEWSGETTRFYREGDKEWQRQEDEFGRGKQRREQERKEASDSYYLGIDKKKAAQTLQPGESIEFESKFFFRLPHGAPGSIYKAEMYLGAETWVPVHITPMLGTLYALEWGKDGKPTGDFYYSQEGTNQYLYAKEGEKLKRVAEMKLKSTPLKESKEDIVTFQSPDGTKKTLTREQAAEIIREREQQNP